MRVDTLESGPRMSQVFDCFGQFAKNGGGKITTAKIRTGAQIGSLSNSVTSCYRVYAGIVAKAHTWIVAVIVASSKNPSTNASNNGHNSGQNYGTPYEGTYHNFEQTFHNSEARVFHNYETWHGCTGHVENIG